MFAQASRLGHDIDFHTSLTATAGSGDNAPFWFTGNRYGLGTIQPNSGLLRLGMERSTQADQQRRWRIGYGLDVVGAVHHDSRFILQQAYADFQYKEVAISVGQKERPTELRDNTLSSGGMAMGINARPLPQVRFEMPRFWAIPKTNYWFAFKGHVAYGWYTDNQWQRRFNAGTDHIYSINSKYHSKAGYIRIGNTDYFPLVLSGGYEMVCQFGGTLYNRAYSNQPDGSYQNPCGLKQYLQVFIPTGTDIIDGNNKNATGNQVGSYSARLDYMGQGWSVAVYGEHFFEDHSQLGFNFAWKDMTLGLEAHLPQNPILSTLVYEYLRTTDQSGPIFRANTTDAMHSLGGIDDYYNHGMYGSYQHAGFVLGNPLLRSPIYNKDGNIYVTDNRITAHHLGLSGHPDSQFSWRLLYTHVRSLGTYDKPAVSPRHANYLLLEASYAPRQAEGLTLTASYGQNGGQIIGQGKGAMLSVAYTFRKK